MYLIQATADGWKVVRPSGVVMNLKTLNYALFLTDGEPRQVFDARGYRIA